MTNQWTDAERDLLRAGYLLRSRKELEQMFPNRTWSAIEQRANHLGLRRVAERERWTPEQIEVLKVEYPNGARLDELAQKLRKSPSAIKTAASRLVLERKRRQVPASPFRFDPAKSLLGHLNEAEKGYLAGLFDGEGCVTFSRIAITKRRPHGAYILAIRITNTDPRVIEWLCAKVPSRMSFHSHSKGRRQAYTWALGLHRGVQFCRELSPYLIVKREETDLVAERLRNGVAPLSAPEREKLREMLRILKTKGHVTHPIAR